MYAEHKVSKLRCVGYTSLILAQSHLFGFKVYYRPIRVKTLSGGEFGWGGTSVKDNAGVLRGDSSRTEISSRTKG